MKTSISKDGEEEMENVWKISKMTEIVTNFLHGVF